MSKTMIGELDSIRYSAEILIKNEELIFLETNLFSYCLELNVVCAVPVAFRPNLLLEDIF